MQTLLDPAFEKLLMFLENFNDPDASKIHRRVQTLAANIDRILTDNLSLPERPSPICLVHMDFWCDNILFRVKEEDVGYVEEPDLECSIIDWQMVSVGKPTHDLALLMNCSLSPKVRRENRLLCLQYYYEVFRVGCIVTTMH